MNRKKRIEKIISDNFKKWIEDNRHLLKPPVGNKVIYENGKIKSLLNLHKPQEGKDYLIGIFMTGAYQEALGNLHNLFGSTNDVHIDINQDNSYKVKNIIKELDPSKAVYCVQHDYTPKEKHKMDGQ